MTPSNPNDRLAVRPFARAVSLRLMLWSLVSMAGGALLWRRGTAFGQGFGVQALAWGAIDGMIAAAGLVGQQRTPAAGYDAPREARKLRRLLWFNAMLDVGYIAGGLWLARTKGRDNPVWRGHGWGIVVQGAFLFWFDLFHALRVPRVP